ncbi:unnamed protein product [Prorocentrum cordatum]|uniref:Distal membrane arm assembly complex 2-like protein n=1 Tax=Prorocentrum cordatum TaxID=2364126 RepID=A0ABN9XTK6_9DINO|nr:unnamed protein product [Polarella glacialis]
MSRAQLGGVTRLDYDGIPPPTPEQAAGLASCLRLCARLEMLDLRNSIGDEGAQALFGALPSLPGLRELYLSRNSIGDEGARALAGALPSLPGLQDLRLPSNSFGDEGRAGPGGGAALPAQPAVRIRTRGGLRSLR